MKARPWRAWACLLSIAIGLTGCQTLEICRRPPREPALLARGAAPAPAPVRPGVIPITPENASVEFTGATALQSKSGHFTAFDGTFEMPSDDPKEAKIRVAVDVGSVTTSIGLLTRHLKGEDFFDVAQYPRAEFVSEAVAPGPEPGVYQVAGQLQFHGITRRVEFPVRISVTPNQVAFDGTMTVRQSEFGMIEGARKAKDEVPVQVSFRGRRE